MGDDFLDSDGAIAVAAVAVAVAGRSSSVVGDDDFFSGGCDDAIFAAMVLLLLGWSVQTKAKESADSRTGAKPKFCLRIMSGTPEKARHLVGYMRPALPENNVRDA
jgi:hypothetical protein